MYVLIALYLLAQTVNNVLAATGDFGYSGANGPDHWSGACALGNEQSPIDLKPQAADIVCAMPLFDLSSYQTESVTKLKIKNTGTTAHVSFPDGPSIKIKGGGLLDEYDLAQFHFHWADTDDKGSEHTVDRKWYPMEMHFVHIKSGSTGVPEAVTMRDGLAVLGVFFEIGQDEHPGMKKLVDHLRQVNTANSEQTVTLPTPIKLSELLPSDTSSFYRYPGSLTTPGCNENVVWTVFSYTVKISAAQMEAFRGVVDSAGNMMTNYRPTQPLNNRRLILRQNTCPARETPTIENDQCPTVTACNAATTTTVASNGAASHH